MKKREVVAAVAVWITEGFVMSEVPIRWHEKTLYCTEGAGTMTGTMEAAVVVIVLSLISQHARRRRAQS